MAAAGEVVLLGVASVEHRAPTFTIGGGEPSLPLPRLHAAFPFQPSLCFYIQTHSLPTVQARGCSALEFGHSNGAAFVRGQMRRRK
jgi:hypothetical protein